MKQIRECRPIPGFPAYRVWNDGVVESCWVNGPYYPGMFMPERRWTQIQNAPRPDGGYIKVTLRDINAEGKKHRAVYVHVLVAEVFHGPKPFPKACVRHLDGKSSNNWWENLKWGTYKENNDDLLRHGTRGVAGKLNIHHARTIRARVTKGESRCELAREYRVSPQTIGRIVNNLIWIEETHARFSGL